MSRPMTFQEFASVILHVAEFNSPRTSPIKPAPTIKYVNPVFDMRGNVVFSITFRGFGGGEHNLHCQNESRELSESLYERCMTYLKGKTA